MLDYKILEYKYKYTKDNDTFVDLMSNSYNIPYKYEGFPLLVSKYYVARPDLISLAVYGSDEYADIICKINGISNPFELNEGDLIYIPDVDTVANCFHMADSKEAIAEPNDNILNQKKKNNFQKKKDQRRSSNEQVEGDKIFVIDKSLGMIFF